MRPFYLDEYISKPRQVLVHEMSECEHVLRTSVDNGSSMSFVVLCRKGHFKVIFSLHIVFHIVFSSIHIYFILFYSTWFYDTWFPEKICLLGCMTGVDGKVPPRPLCLRISASPLWGSGNLQNFHSQCPCGHKMTSRGIHTCMYISMIQYSAISLTRSNML